MDLALIQPSYGAVYGFKEDISSKLPPLSLMALSSYAKKRGHNVEIVDLEVDSGGLERVLKDKRFSFFGISATSSSLREGLKIARIIKSYDRDNYVIFGGPHASAAGYELFGVSRAIDCVVFGEGEETLMEILDRGGKDLAGVKGLAYRDDYGFYMNAPRDFIQDLDELPFPDHLAVFSNKYKPSLHRDLGGLSAVVMTSRGCPFGCAYCGTQTTFGRNVRFRSVENVLKEIEFLKDNLGVGNVMFWDDSMTLDRDRIMKLSSALKDYGVLWSCNTRADLVDEEVLDKMAEGGCKVIFYGVESSNEDILKKLGRNILLSVIESAVSKTKEKGIKAVASMMIGVPFDDKKQIEENVGYMIELNPDLAFFSAFAPQPGTPLYDYCVQNGLISKWPDWLDKDFEGVPLNMPSANPNLSREEIQDAVRDAYFRFYSREDFFRERSHWKEKWELNVLESLRRKFT